MELLTGNSKLLKKITLINCYVTLFLPSPSSACLSLTGRCNSSLASPPSDKHLRRLLIRLHRRLLLRFHLFAVYPATVSPTPSPTASPIRLHLRRLLFQSIGLHLSLFEVSKFINIWTDIVFYYSQINRGVHLVYQTKP
ncbi:hypothetical protein L2E82_42535 [Cichorium intybus]|uniref:Uncharacterized protein n=1 Tax=Cichorium intybus TaxID=13427 RepID=A0ACB8ZLA0_CICIN|nr:hypothetical protein L2E82_42535 [Cichorium intybus]